MLITHLSGRGIYILFWNLLRKAVSSSQGQFVAHSRIKCWGEALWSVPSIYNKTSSICYQQKMWIIKLFILTKDKDFQIK